MCDRTAPEASAPAPAMGCGGKDPTFCTLQEHPPSHPLAMARCERPFPLLPHMQTPCHCPHSLLHSMSHAPLLHTLSPPKPHTSPLTPPASHTCHPAVHKNRICYLGCNKPIITHVRHSFISELQNFDAQWYSTNQTHYQHFLLFIRFSKQGNRCYKLKVT